MYFNAGFVQFSRSELNGASLKCKSQYKLNVSRFLAISSGNVGGLDGHRMMPADDTRGDVWTAAGAWEGLACGGGAA